MSNTETCTAEFPMTPSIFAMCELHVGHDGDHIDRNLFQFIAHWNEREFVTMRKSDLTDMKIRKLCA